MPDQESPRERATRLFPLGATVRLIGRPNELHRVVGHSHIGLVYLAGDTTMARGFHPVADLIPEPLTITRTTDKPLIACPTCEAVAKWRATPHPLLALAGEIRCTACGTLHIFPIAKDPEP